MKTSSDRRLLPVRVPAQAGNIIYLVLVSLAQAPHFLRDIPNRSHHTHSRNLLLPNSHQGTPSTQAHAKCLRGISLSTTPSPRCCRYQKLVALRLRHHTRPRPMAARANTRLRLTLRPPPTPSALADLGLSRHRRRRRQRRRRPSHLTRALKHPRCSLCLAIASNHPAISRACKSHRFTCLSLHMDSTNSIITSIDIIIMVIISSSISINSSTNSAPSLAIRRRRHCRRCPIIRRASHNRHRSARSLSPLHRVLLHAARVTVHLRPRLRLCLLGRDASIRCAKQQVNAVQARARIPLHRRASIPRTPDALL